jgi:hypothetical protein
MTMDDTPVVTTPETIRRRSGYQAMQPVVRPAHWGVDRDRSRRPGVPMERKDPRPMPNTRFPPERQRGEPASPMHGRPNKTPPPVFGTATPLHGLSGLVKRLAYRLPDHKPSHWLLKMFGDRVESWGQRLRRFLPLLAPLALIGFLARRSRD